MRAIICTLMLAAATIATAQNLNIQPVKMTATIGDQDASAKGYLRLIASKDLSLTLLGGDLRTSTGDTIYRNAVSISGEAALKKGQPKDLPVQIDGIRKPGTYEGVIDLYAAEDSQHPEAAAVHYTASVMLIATTVPKLALVGTQPIAWSVVHCTNRVSCALVDRLLPTVMRQDKKTATVEDQHNATTAIDAQLLTTTANGSAASATVKAEQRQNGNRYQLTVTFNRDQVAPGVYPAILEVRPHGRDEVLTVPVSLDVRIGPFVALIAIVVGVVIGRLSQILATPLFQFQSGLLGRVYQIRNEAERVVDPALRALLLERVTNVIDRIELASAADTAITTDVEAIAALTLISLRFDRLVNLVEQMSDPTKRDEMRKRASDIRQLILTGQTKDAETQLTSAEGAVGAPRAMRLPVLEARPAAAAGASRAEPREQWIVRTLRFLAGTRGPAPARVKYAVVKPALFFVLLVVLCLTGFNTLYVKAPAGFGSAGLFDLLGLFMWGLTADVAQSTLQRLPK